MKIAINNLPLRSGHKTRGIGYYTEHLVQALKENSSVEVRQFTSQSEIGDVDVIHYPWFDFFFHTLPISKKFSTVVTIHDVIPLVFPQHYPIGFRGKINFELQKIALKSCKHIITDSKSSKNDIINYLKIKNEKITVIPLAADEKFKFINNDAKLLFVKKKHQLPDQFLLYVGDANWVKNLPFLIKGFRQLVQSTSFANLKLVLVGGVFLKDVENINHPELESLKLVNQLVKQYGLVGKIYRPGQIDDVELVAFYNLATAYVQPSIYEGFGLPILQAFACGTPVISSNKASLVEVGGESALYFDPTNLEQFISLASKVVKDKFLQGKLSELGLKQATKFSWKNVADQTKQVYFDVVTKK